MARWEKNLGDIGRNRERGHRWRILENTAPVLGGLGVAGEVWKQLCYSIGMRLRMNLGTTSAGI